MKIQLEYLKEEIDELQIKYGNPRLNAVYGAGCIRKPKILFLFMNPTARNISAGKEWYGLRAPWIGTKNIWKLFYALKIINAEIFRATQGNTKDVWTEEFTLDLYNELNKQSIYLTNLAKCTQDDARALDDTVFRTYLENTKKEIYTINPIKIVSFGNQVSSILLGKNIKVSDYVGRDFETLIINDRKFDVFPTYYPVGQGMRNIDKAIKRIKLLSRAIFSS